jgi:rsbT co-antagonist protein RsbR
MHGYGQLGHSHSHGLNATGFLEIYRITPDDLARVASFAEVAVPRMQEMVDKWYAWLRTQPEYEHFFSDEDTLERVQRLQDHYWHDFMAAEVNDEYVERRRRVGEAHARIGLPLNTYFAGMNMFLELFSQVLNGTKKAEAEQALILESVAKLLHLDTAIVVDTYNALVEERLTAQAKSLMEMSTPVTQIWSGILLLPIVGIIDSQRAREIMNATLAKIAETQARIFIMDISGVGVVDTAVANHLVKITKATQLMGCESTISGVSPAIAQTIVELGVDVGTVKTTSTMRDALGDAFHRVGMEIKEARPAQRK